MKQFRLSLLLAVLVGIGMGGTLATMTGGMAAPHATADQNKDAKHPRRKDYTQKFQQKWDYLDWCFADLDHQLTMAQQKTLLAIDQYVQAARVGADLDSCTDYDRALVGIEFVDLSSGELTDISPIMGLHTVKRVVADSNSFEEIEAAKHMPKLEYIQVYKYLDLKGKQTSVKCPDFGKRKVTCCVDGWKKQDCTWPKE
ncbi:MAG: hypothetical protein M3X11_04635 [Acidobacteriota bacterium]|nr:hypothetical protein [Acidobacteriota bacterium]